MAGTVSKRCSLLLACVDLLGSSMGAAHAAEPSELPAASPGGLEYDAPPGCPSRQLWMRRVLERLDGAQHAWSAEDIAGVPARVTVRSSGTEALVELASEGVGRSIHGADCDEVASAAALIVAVALSASAPVASGDAPGRQDEPGTADGVSGPPPPERASVASVVASTVATPAVVATPQEDRDVAPPADRERGDLGVELGANAELNGWTGPWPAWLASLSVDLVSRSHAWSARVAAVYGASETSVGQRRAVFSYWGVHGDLCPIVRGASWRWAGCTELHAGLLSAEGDERSALARGQTQRGMLVTGAASTRLEAPPLWGGRIGVEAGIAVPLLRQTFQFESPTEVIFESPPLGLFGRVGLRVPLDGRE